ncbi:hypothetical protein H0H81_004131, partial [Sphagnurus paluster]
MTGVAQLNPENILDNALDWDALPANSVVVDFGGGIGTASVALLRNHPHLKFIVQDSAQILKSLRAAATPDTQLITLDNIVAYTCHDPTSDKGIGKGTLEAPAPLLANFGVAKIIPYTIDLT